MSVGALPRDTCQRLTCPTLMVIVCVQVHQREPCNHQEAKSCYLKAEALMKANGVRIPLTTSAQHTSAQNFCTKHIDRLPSFPPDPPLLSLPSLRSRCPTRCTTTWAR